LDVDSEERRLRIANESLVVVRFCLLSLQVASPPSCFENGRIAQNMEEKDVIDWNI